MKFAKFIVLGFILALCMCFTYTYDTATPVGTDAPSVIDDRIREVKAANQERMNVDHYWPLTGTEVSDTDVGYHRAIHYYSTTGTDPVLDFTTVSGVDELRYTNSSGGATRITSAGGFNMALLTSGTITTPTLTSPVLNTGVSGTAILDEDDMASNSATKLATQQSIKAYVDAQIAAVGSLFGTWASKATDTSYLAATDGLVCAYSQTGTALLYGYTDSSNPPTTQRLEDDPAGIAGGGRCLTMPVKKGDYWKVTGAATVYWLPVGS